MRLAAMPPSQICVNDGRRSVRAPIDGAAVFREGDLFQMDLPVRVQIEVEQLV